MDPWTVETTPTWVLVIPAKVFDAIDVGFAIGIYGVEIEIMEDTNSELVNIFLYSVMGAHKTHDLKMIVRFYLENP